MSAVDALNVASAAGVRVSLDDGDLLLEAPAPPPQNVLELLSRHKTDIVTLLCLVHEGWSAEDWRVFFDERAGHFEFDCGLSRASAEIQAFECCIVEWLDRHPAPSSIGRCAGCGNAETRHSVTVPYGAGGIYTWLHRECWRPWYEARLAQATKALTLINICPRDGLRTKMVLINTAPPTGNYSETEPYDKHCLW